MSLESVTLRNELKQIAKARRRLMKRVKAFKDFILSDDIFEDDREFERRLSAIQDSVITLAELTVPPTEYTAAAMERAKEAPEKAEKQLTLEQYTEKAFTLPKALVSIVVAFGTFVLAEKGIIPPIAVFGVVAAILAFAFAPQLKELIRALQEKKPEAVEEEELTLEEIEKISGLFDEIRNKYVSAYFLIRWQGRPDEPIPEAFEGLGWAKELLIRGEQMKHTLPHEFEGKIGKIVAACERSIWQRKQFIVSAMVQSMASLAVQR